VGDFEMVFLDIGGVMYDDRIYARAWDRALRDAGASFTDDDFAAEYEACKRDQNGSFRRRLATRFLGPDADLDALERLAARYWSYPATALYDDVRPTLERLRAEKYRLGIIANQPSEVRSALRRDGLDTFFDTWGVSDDLGMQKPDPKLFEFALQIARVEPRAAVMVGDRLDYDIRPAKRAGMRTVWMLRGEAPHDPTPDQLVEADLAIRRLDQLPPALASL
jgi:HAD superfamily hydrolase (TIGR01662 family)